MKRLIVIILVIYIVAVCCKKPKVFSDVPKIEFDSFRIIDSTDALGAKKFGILSFSFVDGDGDIGLTDADTIPPFDTSSIYYHDLFIDMFRKVNGNYDTIKLLAPYYYRLPYYVSTGSDKAVQGRIIIDMIMPIPAPSDTMELRFYIYDRAKHKSNTASSPDFLIK